MANYVCSDTQLTAIADAIRAKTKGSEELAFPDDFVSEIGTLTDTSDANATASDIKSGKKAYVNGQKITGNYTPTVSIQKNVASTRGFQIAQGTHNPNEIIAQIGIKSNEIWVYGMSMSVVGNFSDYLEARMATETVIQIVVNYPFTAPQKMTGTLSYLCSYVATAV